MEEKTPNVGGAVPTLRTYKTDVEELLGSGKGSLIGMAAAEQKKAPAPPLATRGGAGATDDKRLLYLKLSLGLIVLGIIAVAALYFLKGQGSVTPLPLAQSLITINPTDTTEEITIDSLDRVGLVSKLTGERTQKNVALNTLHLLAFTTGKDTAKEVAAARTFLALLGTRASETLLRALGDKFAYGLHNFRNNQPFLIFSVNDYQNAFAGMLAWESAIQTDLQNFFIAALATPPAAATTTAALFRASTQAQFVDGVIANKDVRLIRDANGNTVFLYSFVNPKTLVLTTNSDTLKEIMRRLVVSQQ